MTDSRPTDTLRSVHTRALMELEVLRSEGRLSAADYSILVNTKRAEDIILSINSTLTRDGQSHLNAKQRLEGTITPLLLRLERFGSALDILVQSFAPQIMGINILGLVWGGLRFIIAVARDIIDTFESVLNILDDISKKLAVFEKYMELFGSSDIKLLEQPLVNIYVEIIAFGLKALKLFNQSTLRTIGQFTWTSLRADLISSLSKIESAAKQIDSIAQVEHMYQAGQARLTQDSEVRKSEAFRQEIRMHFARNIGDDVSSPTQLLASFNDAPLDLLSVHFTGRKEELGDVETMLNMVHSDGPSRCAIHGMPGLGKTQLALQYSKLFFESHKGAIIFWISAASLEKLNQGYSKILNLVNHPERMHLEQSARQTAARRWLEQLESKGPIPWLVVFDNVNRRVISFLKENLPRHGRYGRILFTTRTKDVATTVCNAAGHQYKTLELKVPKIQDATKLFLDQIRAEEDQQPLSLKEKVMRVVGCLGYLPLAINQAASFMNQSYQTVDNLLDLFTNGQKYQIIEWENDLSDYEAKSIAATFSSQLEDLRCLHPNTSHLLKLLAFFDVENIRTALLTEGAPGLLLKPICGAKAVPPPNSGKLSVKCVGHWDKLWGRLRHQRGQGKQSNPPSIESEELESLFQLMSSPIRLRKALQELHNLSLITRQAIPDGEIINIHDFVQSVIQEVSKTDGSQPQWFRAAVRVMCRSTRQIEDPSSPGSWNKCEEVISHINSLTEWDDILDAKNSDLQEANTSIATYLRSRGRYNEAKSLFQRVLSSSENLLGPDHANTINLMLNLGDVEWDLGKYNQAIELYNQALGIRERESGRDHLDTLKIVEKIANIQKSKGLYDQAESLYNRVLEGREAKLEKDDLSTIQAVSNLAKVHRSQGKYEEAEILYNKILKEHEKQLGANSLETLRTADNLANCYLHQCRYEEAAGLFDRVLKGLESQLGYDHPDTLWTVDNLAQAYRCQGRHTEAEALYLRALAGNEVQFGCEHQQTLWTIDGLANVYLAQERYTEARSLFERALAGREKCLGDRHPITLRTVHGLARVSKQEGKYIEAGELYNRVLCGRRTQLRQDHPDTLRTLHELGNVYRSRGCLVEAEELYKQAISASNIQLGASHMDTQKMIQSLNDLLNEQRR